VFSTLFLFKDMNFTFRTGYLMACLGVILSFFSCNNRESKPAATAVQQKAEQPVEVQITDLNCWVEKGYFLVTGLCDSKTSKWLRISLAMVPLDSTDKPMAIKGKESARIVCHSEAVPPLGRTSFFAAWPLADFAALPDSCLISDATAVEVSEGPILLATSQSGIRIMRPSEATNPQSEQREIAWDVRTVLENPLSVPANHPKMELLLYGKDKRLWFAQVVDPESNEFKKLVHSDQQGPMLGGTKRQYTIYVSTQMLPEQLQVQQIWKADILPFEARQ
jgi:hypothetical protein